MNTHNIDLSIELTVLNFKSRSKFRGIIDPTRYGSTLLCVFINYWTSQHCEVTYTLSINAEHMVGACSGKLVSPSILIQFYNGLLKNIIIFKTIEYKNT